jgi:hypothetical protein
VGETAVLTFTFSDAPSGFALGDITASGTVSGLAATANPLVYTALYTPTAGTAAASESILWAPACTPTRQATRQRGQQCTDRRRYAGAERRRRGGQFLVRPRRQRQRPDHQCRDAIITGTLDTALVAGELVQVSLNNGVSWLSAVATSTTNWALTPQALSGSGTLQVRVSDAAGNTGPVFSAAYVLDLVAPTMVVTSSATTLKAGESATLTFTFSEAPSGFAAGDLVAVNGTLSGFTVTANPLVYTAVLTPSAGLAGGTASVTLAAGCTPMSPATAAPSVRR